jgi:hypothetical protein
VVTASRWSSNCQCSGDGVGRDGGCHRLDPGHQLCGVVPLGTGVNISQTSARFQHHLRSATGTLATSTLALLDGRSSISLLGLSRDLPVNPNELKQIEVIRGPASAV